MARRGSRDLAVGTMFALALTIVALAVMAIGGDSGLLLDRVLYTVNFPQADGLVVGAPVRMSGVQVGTVSAIRLSTDPAELGIQATLGVERDYAERVRADSRAALRILQILTNEKFVELLPGTTEQPALASGAEIQPLEEPELFERGEAIAENLSEITVALRNILEPLEQGEGLIGRMFQDPEFGQEGVEAVSATVDNLKELTDRMLAGEGLAGRLLTDQELASKLDGLGVAVDNFAQFSSMLTEQQESIETLLSQAEGVETILADLREAGASLRRVAAALESERGLLGQLLDEESCLAKSTGDLCSSMAHLSEILRKIDEGEGTLGALVNEREVYDGVEQIATGVNDSKFMRWLLRRYRKKGIKAQDDLEEDGG